MIILFGSMANGITNGFSDVDLLIVSENTLMKKDITAKIVSYSSELSLKTDVLIYSRSEIERESQKSNSFIVAIIKLGNVVYKNNACVKSSLRQLCWALKIPQTVEHTPRFAFSGLYEHFRLSLPTSKIQNWAKIRPHWPLRTRFHGSVKVVSIIFRTFCHKYSLAMVGLPIAGSKCPEMVSTGISSRIIWRKTPAQPSSSRFTCFFR